MIVLINILTIVFAAIIAVKIVNKKNKYRLSVALIIIGIIWHFLEAYINYSLERCKIASDDRLISVIDKCLDYESGNMFYAQAMIIAGFTAIVISYFSGSKSEK